MIKILFTILIFFFPIVVAEESNILLERYVDQREVEIVENNNVLVKNFLPEGYVLKIPQKIQFKHQFIDVVLYSRGFESGDVVYFEIKVKHKHHVKNVSIKDNQTGNLIPISPTDYGYAGLFPINPEISTNEIILSVEFNYYNKTYSSLCNIAVKQKKFKVTHGVLDLKDYSDTEKTKKPEIIKFIEENTAKKKKVFSTVTINKMTNMVSHPRDMHYITSTFYESRLYRQFVKINKNKKELSPTRKIHRGIDFRGIVGAPVYAVMPGIVVIAEEMYYEGNFVVIDHGNRIFTYYMHMSKLNVKEGDFVNAGFLIGDVGSTGISTASHLHISLVLYGVQCDPESILGLPFRFNSKGN